MVHRIIHGDVQLRKELFTFASEISNVSLRRHQYSLYLKSFKTDLYKHHFVNRIVTSWNSLPSNLLDVTSFPIFKKQLKAYMLQFNNPYVFP